MKGYETYWNPVKLCFCTRAKKHIHLNLFYSTTFILTFICCLLLGLSIYLISVNLSLLREKKVKGGANIRQDKIKHHEARKWQIPIKLTVYRPNKKECGNDKGITASGLKVDKKHPQRWVAVGSKLFRLLKLQNINIICNQAPFLNGFYRVVDTSGKDTQIVEILNSNPDKVKLGLCLDAIMEY